MFGLGQIVPAGHFSIASDEQFLGEELGKEPAEEKWPPGRMILFTFSASLALWAIIIFLASQIF